MVYYVIRLVGNRNLDRDMRPRESAPTGFESLGRADVDGKAVRGGTVDNKDQAAGRGGGLVVHESSFVWLVAASRMTGGLG